MAVMGEARSTPTYPSVAPPRYGGCVSAFLHFFDWTPAKRFSSTKRLSASKLPYSYLLSIILHIYLHVENIAMIARTFRAYPGLIHKQLVNRREKLWLCVKVETEFPFKRSLGLLTI